MSVSTEQLPPMFMVVTAQVYYRTILKGIALTCSYFVIVYIDITQ